MPQRIGLGQIYYGPSLALNYNGQALGQDWIHARPTSSSLRTSASLTLAAPASLQNMAVLRMMTPTSSCWFPILLLVPARFLPGSALTQVAPTILKALGLNPSSLDGVRLEGTPVLPEINLQQFGW